MPLNAETSNGSYFLSIRGWDVIKINLSCLFFAVWKEERISAFSKT